MRIRMTGEFTYDLDDAGRQRTLPKGGVFDEPDAVAAAAVGAGRAVRLDPASSAEDAADDAAAGSSSSDGGGSADTAADPAAAPVPAARKPRA